ncbi:Sexual differentiation process protein isp4 [Paramyrothecium foliicola]|nr:Sexual differentiation process protein isp4 [Paramyrothecium foliicola]
MATKFSPSLEKVPGEAFVPSLEALIREHELDQNFPQDILKRARAFLADRNDDRDITQTERAKSLIKDFVEYQDLVFNDSAYPEVRAVVEPTDDPSLPIGTFRVFLLGTLFTLAGTAIQQFFSLRLPSIAISTYVVQLLSMPLGVLLAKWLPTRSFGSGSWRFTLNPGPFNQKEHILIAMMANVAFGGHSTGAYIVSMIQVLKLDVFYGEKVLSNNVAWQITTLLATQLLGYGCAGMARRFLVYPPAMIWQKPLATIALTKALVKDGKEGTLESANGWTISRYRFFLACFAAMFVWYWVPNYLFEALALFNWPTWVAPGSVTLALIAGSTCGLGINPLPTLDWNIATYLSDPIITPLFTLMNFASGMAVMGFVVAPILYFRNVWNGGYFPINSNRVYDNTGSFYDVRRILNDDMTFNPAAYYEYSIPWMSTTQILNYVGFFALYVSIPVHMAIWYRKQIADGLRSCWRRTERADDFKDVHNRLMSAYRECPHWWYLVILATSIMLACLSATLWPTGMPVWTIFLAVVFTVILQIPVGILAAVTNMEVSTSILAQVIGGYALEGQAIPNMMFKMYSYMATSQSLNFVSDLKMAHYAKIPPRWAFAAQVYATMMAAFVALGVNHWVLRNVEDICTPGQKDRFTCPHTHSYFLSSVLWGVIGPRRLFSFGAPYNAVTWGIPVGIALPILAYLASKRWPSSSWRSVNAPVFLAGPLGWAPYNWSYMQGAVVLSLVFNGFVRRRYRAWWERYAYVMSGSLMAAIGIAGLVMFFGLQRWDVRLRWWGNSVHRMGVDGGGWLDAAGKPVRCAHLEMPDEGFFSSGF